MLAFGLVMGSKTEEHYVEESYQRPRLSEESMLKNASAFYDELSTRRSIRHFSSQEVPEDVVKKCIQSAMTAPSGANKQPWTFALISNKETKRKIRVAAEVEEEKFYNERAPATWLGDLSHLGTNSQKPFLEQAPMLIVLFAQKTGPEGERHYYVSESVGIAAGFLIAALHCAGLSTLTHTPSPMAFLNEILERPKNEKPFLLLPVGFASDDCKVPTITKKTLSDTTLLFQ